MLSNEVLRRQKVTRRTFVLAGFKIGMLSLLLGRMFYMQLLKSRDYKILSDKNRINLSLITPSRGLILDRNRRKVAENRRGFFLKIKNKRAKSTNKSIEHLSKLLNLTDPEKRQIHQNLRQGSKTGPITILKNISWEKVAKVEENLDDLPHFFIEQGDLRHYNFGYSFAHVTGYLGRSGDDDTSNSGALPIEFMIGKTGIEKTYNKTMQGTFGLRKSEVDAKGMLVRHLETISPENGSDLILNVDSEVQEYAYSILPEEGASVIVMDINDGSVVTCCSRKSYDPNQFAEGIASEHWKKLINDPFKPLNNKIISGLYAPGSTFKLFTILSALEHEVPKNTKFFCGGFIDLGKSRAHCWKHDGHGLIDMQESLKFSCNCYMYNVAKIVGIDKILEVAARFGYGTKTGIDLNGEAKGFVPDQSWKLRNLRLNWSAGDYFNISIGQGPLLSTPIQQVVVAAAIANGGRLLTPRVNKEIGVNYKDITIKKDHRDFLCNSMYRTVNEAGGAAYGSRSSVLLLAGKTGTSQVIRKKSVNDDLSLKSIAREKRNHALFSGFFPFNDPRFAIFIIVDHGGAGARNAAPIAKKLAEYIHERL